MIIDSHQHFWKYTPDEFDWISNAMSSIRRDFLPADLHREITAAGVGGSVAVQARQDLKETRWLLELAEQNDFIRGVVGWVPLASPDVADLLAGLCQHKKLRGMRHVIQGEPDPMFMRGREFNDGISRLKAFGITYDLLVIERQLPEAIRLVDHHPNQVFVLDHIAKPLIAKGELEPWRKNLRDLAKRANVYCKISGMVTEAKWSGPKEDPIQSGELKPFFEAVLEAFSPHRLMFGSDWPVCLVAAGYSRWLATVQNWCAALSDVERDRIFSGTTVEAYRLEKMS